MLKKKPSSMTPSPPLSSSSPPSPHANDAVSEDDFAMMGPIFPSDLITSILSRLPVKSLGKFKCVSKQWLETITDPDFVSTCKTFSLNNPNMLLLKKIPVSQEAHMKKCTRIDVCPLNFDGSSKNLEFSLYLNDDAQYIDMLPSKWDIICFVSQNGFYVCNPSTQKMMKLPKASCCTSGEVNAGMGYVKERDEYVLVHLFDKSLEIHVDNYIGCEVLRLSEGKDCEWKVVEANCPFMVRGWGFLVNNVFYWMFWDNYTHPTDDAIISFDLEKEEFGTVLPPEGCFDPHGAWSLVELGGNLCLVDNATRPFTMDLWVMKDYDNQKWVREYSIDLNGYSNDTLKFIIPLEFWDGKILMDEKQESLDCYDVENKCIKRMGHRISGEWNWLRLYTESFFSLGSQ